MAEAGEEGRSEGDLGAELSVGEASGSHAQEGGVGERIRGLQFSSDEDDDDDDDEGGRGRRRDSDGGADEELDGAPVIGADEDEGDGDGEVDSDMDVEGTPDCLAETDKAADSRSVGSQTDSSRGTVSSSGDPQGSPVADMKMTDAEDPVAVLPAPLSSATDPGEDAAAPPSESQESSRQGGDTPEIREASEEGVRIFPPVDIKDEPVDEEYDRALAPQPPAPPRRIKDEPEEVVQPQKSSEELRISSVFSVGGNSTPPTAPVAAPLPSLSGCARASAAPPRAPPPAPPPESTPPPSGGGGGVRVSCSGCTKVLLRGQTAFQRKGSSQLYCSTVCLTAGCALPASGKSLFPCKTCHSCLKDIPNPKDVITAPLDGDGMTRDFCSQGCLSAFKVKRGSGANANTSSRGSGGSSHMPSAGSTNPATDTIKCSVCRMIALVNHEVNYQGTVHKICSDACFARFRSSNNLAMNCCESCGNYCYSGPGQCHLLTIEGATRKFCSQPCLTAYKQKYGRAIPCAGCQTLCPADEAVDGVGPDGKIQLYCSAACAGNANGAPNSSFAGTSFPCTTCRVVAIPQFHLALNDGTIRNFCSYNCVVTFQAGLSKAPPPAQVNGTSPAQESLPGPPSGVPLPPQASASLPPLSAPRHGQAPPPGPSPAQAPPSPSTGVHGPALPAVLPPGPVPAQAPPSLAGGAAPFSHGLVKLSCKQCRRAFSSKPELLQFKGEMVLFCGKVCTEAYRKLSYVTARCEYCKIEKNVRDVVRFNQTDKAFCSEGCKLLFKHDLTKRTGNPVRTCAYCLNITQNVIQNHFGGKLEEFCKEECMALYTVLFYQMAKCDWCLRQGKLLDSVKWLGEMKHFCDLSCLLFFCRQTSSGDEEPRQHSRSGQCEQQQASSTYDQRQGPSNTHDQRQGLSNTHDQRQALSNTHDQRQGLSNTHDQRQATNCTYDQRQAPSNSHEQRQALSSAYEQQRAQNSALEHRQALSSMYEPQQRVQSCTLELQHPQLTSALALPPLSGAPVSIAPLPHPGGAPTALPSLPAFACKEATPVIANVVSLASAPTGQPYVTPNTALQGAVPAAFMQTKINGDASTQTDAMKLPAAPRRALKNKALLCKPINQNKGTLCRPHQQSTESQTDEVNGQRILVLPVPVPIFIPVPVHLYSQYTPVPMGLPVPLPVPLVVHSPAKSKAQTEQNCPPDTSLREGEMGDKPASRGDQGSGNVDSGGVSTRHNREEESTASAPRLGGTDRDGSASAAPPHADVEADFPLESLEPDSRKGLNVTEPHQDRRGPPEGFPPRKRGRKRVAEAKAACSVACAVMPPGGGGAKLQQKYGVNAWRSWVLRERKSNGSVGGVVLSEDVLDCGPSELSEGLCSFIKGVRRPGGEPYTPDSIFYLCLGLQEHLLENGRMENIFTDDLYSEFSLQITSMLRGWSPAAQPDGSLLSRVEEGHLWECKQLGAYSPIVLLNTMLFFCTKLLGLRTLPEHHRLSFASLSRCTRLDTRTAYLRYSAPQKPGLTALPLKRKWREEEDDEDQEVIEMPESTENPLRCPVRLYEFYLSKCPDSVHRSSEHFYLQPEPSCEPNSRLWFSSQPLDGSVLQNMLTRILAVREVHLPIVQPSATPPSGGEQSE